MVISFFKDFFRSNLVFLEESSDLFSILETQFNFTNLALFDVHLGNEVLPKVALHCFNTSGQHVSVIDITP